MNRLPPILAWLCGVMARVAARQRLFGKAPTQNNIDQVSIVCLMDAGRDAALVMRDARRARVVGLPFVGHWLKKAWG